MGSDTQSVGGPQSHPCSRMKLSLVFGKVSLLGGRRMARRGKEKCSDFFIKLNLFHFNGFSSCCHSIFSVVLYFLNQIMMLFLQTVQI